MAAPQRHICHRVSEEKRNAYLGWVNALKADDQYFNDFCSLQSSGFLNIVAQKLYSSGASSEPICDVLQTVLCDYYGSDFIDKAIVDAAVGESSTDSCKCELEWNTAIVVTLLLNRALNDQYDNSHVLICQKFPERSQQEIFKAFNFLATETGERPPPSVMDWRSFLSSPVKERYGTPVIARRSIKPQKLMATDPIPFDLCSTPPAAAVSSRRSSDENGPNENLSFRSPVVEGRGSPLVRSTAKLREKAVEIQKLKRELSDCTYHREMQAIELAEVSSKVRVAEMELEALRRSEKELRTKVWDLQGREEQLVAQEAKGIAMEKEIQRLNTELAAATVDRSLFEGIQKEREHLYDELGSLTNERDHMERAFRAAEAKGQHASEQLHNLAATHQKEIQELVDKNTSLSSEMRRLQDKVDEAHWKGEEIVRLNNEIEVLKKDSECTANSFEKQHKDMDTRIQSLEREVFSLREEKKTLHEVNKSMEAEVTSLKAQVLTLLAEKQTVQEVNNTMEAEVTSLKAQVASLRSEKRKCVTEYESQIQFLEDKAAEERSAFQSRCSQLERQVSALISQRDSLLLQLETERSHATTRLLVPAKRARQDSSRSGTSGGTFAGSSSTMSTDRRNTRFDNEDEDEVMQQTAVNPGDGPAIHDTYIPAARGDNGITPGRKRLSIQSMETTDEEFKVPALPREPLARSLQFHPQSEDRQEESWSSGASFREKLDQQDPGTPWDKRLSTLNSRNQKLPHHLKSSYPVETQLLPADSVKDEELKNSSAFEPSANLQMIKSRGSSPVAEIAVRKKKKTTATEKSPGRKFLSKLAQKTNKESKIRKVVVTEEQDTAPKAECRSATWDIPNTPTEKRKGASKWTFKKPASEPTAIANLKGRKKT